MTEPFEVASRGVRWVIHPPHDPYGDGHLPRVATGLHDGSMSATTEAHVDGQLGCFTTSLVDFVTGLAADWCGWQGVRRWQSLEGELELDARHDGRSQVGLGVTLRAPGPDVDDTHWSARAVLVQEAGEQLSRLAADLTQFLRT